MANWTEDQEDALIQLVEERPALYDLNDRGYSDKVLRARLWREVEEHLEMSEKDVKQRWVSMRTQYTRYKKLSPSGNRGVGMTLRQNWILTRLQFLEPHTKRREIPYKITPREFNMQMEHSAVTFDDSNGIEDEGGTESEASRPSSPIVAPQEGLGEGLVEPPGGAPSPSVTTGPKPHKLRRLGADESSEESATAALIGVLTQTLERLSQPAPRDRISSFLAALEDQIRHLPPARQTLFMCDIQKRYSEIVVQEELFGCDWE